MLRLTLQFPSQVPCLLGHPRAGRLAGTASKVNAPTADLDKEEDGEPPQPDCVLGEEVAARILSACWWTALATDRMRRVHQTYN